ncbi:hypothetical protein EST38_g13193 [Candolleomyces aberdarensis]|uniref:G domain-containing protein n=1 Tax=Candolleomyces aberdarensis TaxID=2316362 RepID=A0A4Q2D2U9_9AGAR|nr:hypothetical protein EST38_g13193 [Candolleomyces aberdarensis]
MDCFKDLFSKPEDRPPLSIAVTKDKALANISLTYLDEYDEIGFEVLNPEEQDQEIRHTIDRTVEDLYEALDHICRYYYHRDHVNTNPRAIGEDSVPFSSKFTIDVFKLEGNDEDIYVPSGPNLNIQGTGIELTIGPHNEEDMYGFRITNHTNFTVVPYLFHLDSSNFSITLIYQPGAVAQIGARELPVLFLSGRSSLAVGYGSAGGTPQNLAISSDHLDLEHGYIRLYVSTRYIDLSFLQQGAISDMTRGYGSHIYKPRKRPHPIWDTITVPVLLTRGDERRSRMIGVIGSRGNGKSAFLEELFNSLPGNAGRKPTFATVFIKEYNITLPGRDEESLTLVDLPAFQDDNIVMHVSMLQAVVAYLGKQYQKGHRFWSLIWCYNISKPRFTVIDRLNANLVKDLTGTEENATVLTTYWNEAEEANKHAANTLKTDSPALHRDAHWFEGGESQLKSLFEDGVEFKRFGVFNDPAAQARASITNPLELITTLGSRAGGTLEVQLEASEARDLGGTKAGKRLQSGLEEEIEMKEKEIRGLEMELEQMDEDDYDRAAILEEKIYARQEIERWTEMMAGMKRPIL